MKKRGRKSAADYNLSQVVTIPKRPKPPAELVDEEQAVWDQVVNAHSGDWISKDQTPLLVQYYRHVVSARRVSQLIHSIEGAEDFDMSEYFAALAAQDRESRTLSALARSMRITNQSRYIPGAAKARPRPETPAPWE